MSKVKLLLYCTKAEPYLVQSLAKPMHTLDANNPYNFNWKVVKKGFSNDRLNGKIVVECDCEKVEEISCCCVPYRNKNNLGYELFIDNGVYKVEWKENNFNYENIEAYKDEGVVFERSDRYIDTMFKNEDLNKMCLSPQQLLDYLKLGNKGYALHLSNVKIFDKPLTFEKDCIYKSPYTNELLLKAPQNMCRVYDRFGNKYILISIRPEWLCKILNGEKTIEVRKQIVKELKELMEK